MSERNEQQHSFSFGEFTLDMRRGGLFRDEDEIRLRPKSLAVLHYLVQRPGALVSRDELLDTVWAGTVVTDDAVTQCLIDIRRAIGDSSHTMIRTVPRRGYVFDIPVTGADNAAASEATDLRSGIPKKRYIWPVALAAALVLAAIAWRFATGPSEPSPTVTPTASSLEPSIAVLPFADLSSGQDQGYFADGVSEDVLNMLAKRLAMKVIARTSSFSYRDPDFDAVTIGRQLDVTHILRGSVRREANTLRINVHLVDTKNGAYVWTESFDRQPSASNIFQIQTEIASAVSDSLSAELFDPEHHRRDSPTENLAALEAYFRGRQLTETRGAAELEEAAESFRTAVQLDPGFALAYVGLADTYRWLNYYGALTAGEAVPEIERALKNALDLDRGLGEAYASLANLQRRRYDYTGAKTSFERAFELSPNYAPLHQWYAEFYAYQLRRPHEGIRYSSKAVALDPKSPIIILDHGNVLAAAGRVDEAMKQFQNALRLDPTFAPAYAARASVIYSATGAIAAAVPDYEQAATLDPESPHFTASLVLAYLDLGDPVRASHWLLRAQQLAPNHAVTLSASMVFEIYVQDLQAAISYAEKLLSASPSDFHALRLLRDYDLDRAEAQAAVERYRRGHPSFFIEGSPEVDGGNFPAAIDLAYLLLQLGQPQQAEDLLQQAMMHFESGSSHFGGAYQIADVKIHAARAQNDAALASLRAAVDAGWRDGWWWHLRHDHALDDLRERSEFQALVDRISEDMNEQRGQLTAHLED